MIKTLLLDIDNTLLNFSASEKIAFEKLLDKLSIPYSDEIRSHYKKVNHALWKDYELGLIDAQTIMEQRFAQTFRGFDLGYSGLEMDEIYRSVLEENTITMDNSELLLQTLNGKVSLIVVTNGIASSQYKRLEVAEMLHYFDFVAVSSEIGYSKPDMRFFETLKSKKQSLDSSSTMIVGDSLSADIMGGINWNIKTCWFNPSKSKNESNIKPDYEIADLMDLINILNL